MIKIDKIHTFSNYLSFSRILLAAPILFFLINLNEQYEYRIYAALLMLLAAVTDYLDGYFARKFDEVSELGKIVDPLADKIAVILIAVTLYLTGEIPPYLFWLIVVRDIVIFLGGIYISNKVGKVLPSNMLGKIAVFIIGIYLLAVVLGVKEIGWLNSALIGATILISIGSLMGYALRGVEVLRYYKNENI